MKVLVTGGAGYIGSHACLELLRAGHEVVGFDNLSNSSEKAISRVRELSGKPLRFERLDLLDKQGLGRLMKEGFDAVMHFAGLKAVGESVEKPDLYRRNNVEGSANLLAAMKAADCRNLVFSSSCTVYGAVQKNPVTESHPRAAVNPYGETKLAVEDMCFELARVEKGWRIALLRYFNPVGADASGCIGEDPKGMPNNLMPFVMQTAVGRRDKVRVWGNDYPTPDGTGVRDYIHVTDLALGHLAALGRLDRFDGALAVNLGAGRGYSVLEVIRAASKAAGKDIPYEIRPRRPGDAAAIWADPSFAKKSIGWGATRGLDEMCADHCRWQTQNPEGFAS
ncbi:MAG TPA: UDP-glucose 4-epimerase GalE [Elusimicrobia bacterium]|nr:MAG: UDP-glucose 4-epimerase GalE [Elusimicrobia bacterium GWA2_66_18]OGR74058.1 MAG: UDP-glucose 4-epimerase GalE [Elusimicrobia bacterium GWC2_65_9]HAZ07747.1 UDP-glucose 4-epimerase GalE [Elusimicrobiota bacterium]